MTDKLPKSFAELGLVFSEGSGCITCIDMSCHNNVTYNLNHMEYNVHISMNPTKTAFRIHAVESANTESLSDIFKDFSGEQEAVKFVCENFTGFKCA